MLYYWIYIINYLHEAKHKYIVLAIVSVSNDSFSVPSTGEATGKSNSSADKDPCQE